MPLTGPISLCKSRILKGGLSRLDSFSAISYDRNDRIQIRAAAAAADRQLCRQYHQLSMQIADSIEKIFYVALSFRNLTFPAVLLTNSSIKRDSLSILLSKLSSILNNYKGPSRMADNPVGNRHLERCVLNGSFG